MFRRYDECVSIIAVEFGKIFELWIFRDNRFKRAM